MTHIPAPAWLMEDKEGFEQARAQKAALILEAQACEWTGSLPAESWLPIAGWEDRYWVSNKGRVLSLIGRAEPRTLTPWVSGEGRGKNLSVTLWRKGRASRRTVHSLVLEAFIGPRPPGMQACHWDDDYTNNTPLNLRWGTPSDNALDAVRNGRSRQVQKTHCPSGHEYSEDNTYWRTRKGSGRPNRRCLECIRQYRDRRRGRTP